MANIFREKSLQKLADPEQLDQLFTVTSPRAWLILLTIGALLIVTLIWGIYGKIPTQITGQGILLSRNQGIFDATADESGRIKDILVFPGEQVKKDQIVAYLDLPELKNQVENSEFQLLELRQEYNKLQNFITKDNQLETERANDLRKHYEQTIANNQKHLGFLEKAIAQRRTVVSSGIITEQHLADLEQQYYKTKQETQNLQNQIMTSQLEEKRTLNNNNDKLANLNLKISSQERELSTLKNKLKRATEVKTPAFGRIIEIPGKPGALVARGNKIVSIEGLSEQLDAVIFLPAQTGKLVQIGMSAQVSPATAKKEEFGAIEGNVRAVAKFPSTAEGMQAVLGNAQLVEQFMKMGPLLYTQIDLSEDTKTYSGFRWTSSQGPNLLIGNGTLATATVTIREQAPITLIIPALKRFFGLG